MIARLSSTAAALGHDDLVPGSAETASAYTKSAELSDDLARIHGSLEANGSALLARGRLRSLRRAVDVFGFHLAGIDLRQNSDVHERVVAELFKASGFGGYREADEASAYRAPARRDPKRQAARVLLLDLLRRDDLRTRDRPRRRRGAPALRRSFSSELRDLEGRRGFGHSGSRAASEGGRPSQSRRRRARDQHRSALRDDRGSPQLPAHHGSALRDPGLRRASEEPWRCPGGDARLFRQQQGRRLPDRELGDLQSRDRADRGFSQSTASCFACFTAAAARSAVAGARATRRSSASRAARCRAPSA